MNPKHIDARARLLFNTYRESLAPNIQNVTPQWFDLSKGALRTWRTVAVCSMLANHEVAEPPPVAEFQPEAE